MHNITGEKKRMGSIHRLTNNIYEEFKCKNWYITFYQIVIFAIKAAENKENNKKICDVFHHKL